MNLDELERLEAQATPGPWQEFAEAGDWWVQQRDADGGPVDGGFVCRSDTEGALAPWHRQEDIDLMIAARNALPALLRVAQAALDLVEAKIRYDVAIDAAAVTRIIPIGTRVHVESDNYGAFGIVVDWRAQEPCYKVQTDAGHEAWYFRYEVTEVDHD